MKKLIILLAFLLCFAGKAQAQTNIQSGPTNPTLCTDGSLFWNTTLAARQLCHPANTWASDGSGSSSPSSLTTFFNGLVGLSPTDAPYNAKGDFQIRTDCSVTQPAATVTCSGSTPFKSTDCQTGTGCTGTRNAIFEFTGAGAAGVVLTGTITSFTSSSTVGLSVATATSVTNQRFAWGTDDTTALNAWVAGVNALGSVHSGYLPKGLFYTKGLSKFTTPALVGPTNGSSDPACNVPVSSVSAPNTPLGTCSLIIQGAGNTMSAIYVATAGQYAWTANANANCGAVLLENWGSYQISNFTVLADGSQHAIGGCTNTQGLVVMDGTAHGNMTNVWTIGMHNALTRGCGTCTASDFESMIQPYSETNDVELLICGGNAGAGACEKMTYYNGFAENGVSYIGSPNGGNITIRQLRIDNVHFLGMLQILNSHTDNQESIVLSNIRIRGFLFAFGNLNVSTGPYNIDISNPYFEIPNSTGQNAAIVSTANATTNIHVTNGMINNLWAACSPCIANITTGTFLYFNQTGLIDAGANTDASHFGGAGIANISNLSTVSSPFVGLGGRGALTASNYLTFTNCNPGSSVSPAACGSAASGTVVVPTTTTTYTVNTTAVTANSRITILPITDASGLTGAPTCNAPPTPFIAYESGRTAATSFTFTLPSTTGASCWTYSIVN